MAKFLQGSKLNSELETLFDDAEKELILISPYIKLHERFISTLKTKIDDPKLKIVVVFGKNELDISKSMKEVDFNFFKQFPNIEIKYEKRLHAKYYANEDHAIITSMNLYSFSQDNNIESGVLVKPNLLKDILSNVTNEGSIDDEAWGYFERVIEQSEMLFERKPEFTDGLLGLGKKYIKSNTKIDKLSDFFADREKYGRKKDEKIKTEPKTASIVKEKNSDGASLVSTTAISKEVGISSKILFEKFEDLGWIERVNDKWALTDKGKAEGAQTKKGQYGEFIAWPKSISKIVG